MWFVMVNMASTAVCWCHFILIYWYASGSDTGGWVGRGRSCWSGGGWYLSASGESNGLNGFKFFVLDASLLPLVDGIPGLTFLVQVEVLQGRMGEGASAEEDRDDNG